MSKGCGYTRKEARTRRGEKACPYGDNRGFIGAELSQGVGRQAWRMQGCGYVFIDPLLSPRDLIKCF